MIVLFNFVCLKFNIINKNSNYITWKAILLNNEIISVVINYYIEVIVNKIEKR